MFVKVDYGGSCNWIECSYINVQFSGSCDADRGPLSKKTILVFSAGDEPVQRYEIDLQKHLQPGVYLLNDHGETVDVIHRARHSNPT